MKKIFLILSCIFLLTGCTIIKEEYTEIEKPTISSTPLSGQYTISKIIVDNKDIVDSFGLKDFIGKEVGISTQGALIGEYFVQSPNFRVKNVNSLNYLLNKYNTNKEKLEIKSDTLEVIDIYNSGDFFCEIIKENSDNIYVVMNGMGSSFIKLSKVKDEISEEEFEDMVLRNVDSGLVYMDGSKKNSLNGFLLGLKYNDNNMPKYATYFFKFEGNNLQEIQKIDKLICPKDSEFIEFYVNHTDNGDIVVGKTMVSDKIITKDEATGTKKEINYLSSDYYGLDIKSEKDKSISLNFRSLGRDDTDKSLSLQDIFDDGEKIFNESAKSKISTDKNVIIDDFNFGLRRNRGFWKFFGRAQYVDYDKYTDFDINVLVPKKIVKYESLSIPIVNIRKTLPSVTDAFTTPNNKFIITLENNRIMVYNLDRGKIDKKEIYKDDIKNPVAVMTEWSTGEFTNTWQKFISTLGGTDGETIE